MSTFRRELIEVLNKHSKENGSNTPDFILAEYLIDCLKAFDKTLKLRESWYGRDIQEPKSSLLFEGMNFDIPAKDDTDEVLERVRRKLFPDVKEESNEGSDT